MRLHFLRPGALGVLLAVLLSCAAPAPKPAPAPPPTPSPVPVPPTPTPRAYAYPAAPRGTAVEDFHGTRVADPFRSLESAEDPLTAAWVEAENALTRSLLERPERQAIRERLTRLTDYERIGVPKRRGARYFFSRNTGLQNQSVYYVQEGPTGVPRELLDPNALSTDGTVAATTDSPGRDGSLFGYALSRSGSDRQEILIRDVATGKDLADRLLWAKFTDISWTPDGKGFYYTRYPETGTVPPGDEHYYPKICFHRLGDSQAKDRVVFEKPTEKEVGLSASVTWDGRWLLIQAWRGASDRSEIWVLNLRKKGAVPVPIFRGYENGYTIAEAVDDRLFIRTDRDAPLGRVISVNLSRPLPGDAIDTPFATVIPASSDILESATIVDRRLVVELMKNASDRLRVYHLNGRPQREIALPGIGSVGARSGEPDQKELFFSFTSYTVPPTNYRYQVAPGRLNVFQAPKFAEDTSAYETEQVWYASRDGTRVSMFLVHRRGLPRSGEVPTLLTGYGGFNANETPRFSSSDFFFLENGGLIAAPNLRGGGEYGEKWHKAGMRENKQNVFDDFIAAAEWLISSGWTRPSRLAIEGGSNGGLLVAAVTNQRPDLFAAVVCAVPVADMLRFHRFTVGTYWIGEYGNADLPEDFVFLYRYSPYHNVRDSVRYPSMLITTADTDDRVVPGHAKKLAARLQEADGGSNPILLRVETKAGHGGGKPTSKRIEENADIWTFVFWRLGMFGDGAPRKAS